MTTTRRWNRIQTQILVWAGEQPLEFDYNGDRIIVPARNEIARRGPRSRYRNESAISKSGAYLPGTLAMSDESRPTDGGGLMPVFRVGELCEYLERDRQDLFRRGFAIVTDPEDVHPVMQELIPIWEANQDARAREIVNTELERRKKLQEKGNPITPGSSEHLVVWAFRHLAKRQAEQRPMLSTDELFAVAAGTYTAPPVEPEPALPVKIGPTTDPVALYQTAESIGVKLSKADLAGLLAGDKDIIGTVSQRIAARRKEVAELEAAAS
jgi:hypothetical protein